MNKRFLIASGGTGGHFYPGFALGEEFKRQGCEVLFVVRKDDPAAKVLSAHGLHYKEIDFMGLPRSISPVRHFKFVCKLLKALRQTRQIVRDFRPEVAIGTGGYISFPLIFTAHFMGVKTAVHDSNARLGLANKVCGKFTDLFMLGLPTPEKVKNGVLTSTPVREEFGLPADRADQLKALHLDPTKPTVLVVGGSQGAKDLNGAVAACAKAFSTWQFIHITGERWFESVRGLYAGLSNAAVLPYSHEIYALMKSVDLIICRSGASTLAELMCCKLPAILVPFPHAAANHQYYNAKIFADTGCAQIVPDDAHLPAALAQAFKAFVQGNTAEKLAAMRAGYDKLLLPNPLTAAHSIAERLKSL